MGFTTNADHKRAFKVVSPPRSKLSSDALELVQHIIDQCILRLLRETNIEQYIKSKKIGKYIMFEVNATLRNKDKIYTQINFTQFSKKLKSFQLEENKLITIAVVADYIMCDLYDKANNKENITVTKEMILDGIKRNKDLDDFLGKKNENHITL